MKKIFYILSILLIILVALLGISLGGQYYLNKQSEQNFKKIIALVNLGPGIQVELASYRPGFYKSQAQTKVTIVDKEYYVNHEIFSGPIIFKPSSENESNTFPFHFDLMLIENRLESPMVPTPITWSITLPYWGGAKIDTRGKPFDYAEENLMIHSGGWKGWGSIDRHFESYCFQYVLPETVMKDKLTEGQMIGVIVKNFTTRMEQKTLNKESQIKLNYKIDQVQHLQTQGVINNLNAELNLNTIQDILNVIINVKIEKLTVGNHKMGPFNLQAQFENLDKQVVENIFERFKARGSFEKEIFIQEEKSFRDLLIKKIKITLKDFSVTLPQGTLSAKGDMVIGGILEGEEMRPAPELNKDLIMKTMNGKISIKISKDLFEDLVHLIVVPTLKKTGDYQNLKTEEEKQKAEQEAIARFKDSLIKNNLLIIQDQSYELKGNFEKGKWVNP